MDSRKRVIEYSWNYKDGKRNKHVVRAGPGAAGLQCAVEHCDGKSGAHLLEPIEFLYWQIPHAAVASGSSSGTFPS